MASLRKEMGVRRFIVTAAGVAALLLAGTGSAPAARAAIHDCASFRAWFLYAMSFLLRRDRVIAIDYFYGV